MTSSESRACRTRAGSPGLAGPIVLVGAGKMGGAMLEGWLGLGLDAKHVVVVEPQPSPEIAALAERGLRVNPSAGAVGETLAAIVIAVKPQVAADVLPALKVYVGPSTVAVSIMAGRTLGFLEQGTGGTHRRSDPRHAQHPGGDRPWHYGCCP